MLRRPVMLSRFLISLAVILTMSACQSTPVSISSPRESDLGATDAYALLREAQLAPATKAAGLRLLAARVLVFNGAYEQALDTLTAIPTAGLSATQLDTRARASAEALFALGRVAQAEQAMASLAEFNGADYLLLAEICSALSNYRCSADGYIQASLLAGAADTWLPADINERIWLALSRARRAPEAFTDAEHHAWWLLQENIRTAGSITGQLQAWRDWQTRYPNHPARLQPPTALRNLSEYRPPQIGLLLPLSGAFAAAGVAVRDGLIAAYLGERGEGRPEVRIYDTGEAPISQLYEQALREGADVLIGPLIKDDVEAFVTLTQFDNTPRLVLNYLDESDNPAQPAAGLNPTELAPPPAPLFQFGIAIEDEAASLADHVLLSGAERLLVVHSQARWAQRALVAYNEAWPYPLTAAPFQNIRGLTNAVGEAMQVAASETRKNEIANILGEPLEFLPRARGDLDAVIALTTQVEAQALVPALKFHFADNLPVFATSQAAIGDELASLAGFELTEMPVFAAPDAQQQAIRSAFNLQKDPLGELYALGYDAYRLATWLPILQPDSQVALPGATGYLWLERGGKFRRDLSVSRIGRGGERLTPN